MDNLKFNIDGKCINGNAATWSIKELLGRKGLLIDFNTKTIKQVGERELSQWDIDNISKTLIELSERIDKLEKKEKGE